MSQLIQALRAFAEESRIPSQLLKPEYTENLQYSREHFQWLKDNLGQEAKRHLNDYATMAMLSDGEYCDALFRAGLALGLELALLGQRAE